MGVLALKLLLAPAFVVAASLVARRHGPAVGGLVGGLPVVAGPILLVIAVQHGSAFGARSSTAALGGLVSLTAFVVTFSLLAPRVRWAVAEVAATVAFLAVTTVLDLTGTPGPALGLALAAASFTAALALLPRAATPGVDASVYPAWDLPLRAVTAALMVLAITGAAASLGSQLSGLLAPFPIITSVLASFTHAQRGPGETIRLLRGMLRGFYVFATVVFVMAVSLGA